MCLDNATRGSRAPAPDFVALHEEPQAELGVVVDVLSRDFHPGGLVDALRGREAAGRRGGANRLGANQGVSVMLFILKAMLATKPLRATTSPTSARRKQRCLTS